MGKISTGTMGIFAPALTQPTNFVPFKNEIHLFETFSWSNANWISLSAQLNQRSVFDEHLPPDVN
jgi:hypothetical protein